MRALSAPFRTFAIRLLVAVMALAMAAGPWASPARPVAGAGNPDLVIEAITTYPIDPVTGDAVTVTVRVKNIGDAQAAPSYVTCEVDGAVLGSTPVSQLVPGMTATATFPWAAVPGAHVIKATADSTGSVAESDETNNTSSYTLMPRSPDLTIDSITWSPENPELRQEVWFYVRVKNTGTTRAGATRVQFFVDYKSYGYQDVPALDPGEYEDIIYPWFAAPGQYLMMARVDDDGAVTESNEDNNEKSVTFTQSLPDLLVTRLYQTPELYSAGDTITLTAEVKNQGAGNARTSEMAFYIDDIELATVSTPALEIGESANVSTTWKANENSLELRVAADVNNIVPESNEANNGASAALGTELPDLTISDVSVTPSVIGVGDIVSLQFTVTNEGAGKALSSRGICQIGVSGSSLYNVPPLKPKESYVVEVKWTAIAGTYTATFTANYDEGIPEPKYTNNSGSAIIMVTPPDLTVSDISWEPEHPDHNTPVTFNVTVENAGSGTAPQSYLGYYIDDVMVFNTIVKSLSSGENVTMKYTWTSESGYHTFKAMTDFKKNIIEANEDNNELSVAIVANMPDLVIQSVSWAPSDLPVGQDATFTVHLRNTGSQPVPLTRLAYYVDDVMAGYVDVPPLAPDGKADQTLTWPVASGPHVIRFVADATDLVDEIDEENNVKIMTIPLPDLVVTGLSPSPASPAIGDVVTMTVTLKNEGQSPTQATMLSGRLDEETARLLPVDPVGPGQTVTKTFQWTATGGTHTFTVAADPTNTTIESDETNNHRSRTITTRTPELTVGDLGWSMPNPLVNNDVDLSAVISNTGNGTAPASKLVYQVDDEAPVTRDVPELAPGDAYTLKVSVDLEPKEHLFAVTVDTAGDAWETDEESNTANLTFNSKAPDLAIRAIGWSSAEASIGDNVTITANVENRGTALVEAADVTLYVDDEAVITQTTGELGIGEAETLRFNYQLTSLELVITVMADLGGAVTESDEANNDLTKTATFTAPEPPPAKSNVLQNLQAPPEPGFISQNWWMILAGAGAFAIIIFVVLFRSFRKE